MTVRLAEAPAGRCCTPGLLPATDSLPPSVATRNPAVAGLRDSADGLVPAVEGFIPAVAGLRDSAEGLSPSPCDSPPFQGSKRDLTCSIERS